MQTRFVVIGLLCDGIDRANRLANEEISVFWRDNNIYFLCCFFAESTCRLAGTTDSNGRQTKPCVRAFVWYCRWELPRYVVHH